MDFSAETVQTVDTGLDTLLGWFDDSGSLIESDDNGGTNFLSLIEGTVPESGTLTFAATGYKTSFSQAVIPKRARISCN